MLTQGHTNVSKHTHTVLKNTLEQAASMKAAIHIANLGALKRLHQMFSQKLWAMLLSGTEWKKISVVFNHATFSLLPDNSTSHPKLARL